MRIGRLIGLMAALLLLTGCGRNTEKVNDAQAAGEVAYGALEITAISGEAADAFVLMGENHVTVIDTGLEEHGEELVDFLKKQGVTRVDNLIITHFDKDHVGGADHVIDNFDIGAVYTTYKSKESDDIDSYLAALSDKGLAETVVTAETSFETDGISYDIYPPQSTAYEKNQSNNSSLVVMVSAGENNMLFAGDAEKDRINELLTMDDIQAEILKVPHHGRYEINTQDLLLKVDPEYAVITSSTEEPEDTEVIQILESAGVTTYLNRLGDITITMSADDISITQ